MSKKSNRIVEKRRKNFTESQKEYEQIEDSRL